MWPLLFWRQDERCHGGFLSPCTHVKRRRALTSTVRIIHPPQRCTVTPTPPYHSWNRKLSPSFPRNCCHWPVIRIESWSTALYFKNRAKIHCISVRGKWILAGLHNHWGCELTVCSLKGLREENKRQPRAKKGKFKMYDISLTNSFVQSTAQLKTKQNLILHKIFS